MRWLIFLLLTANLLFFAYVEGYFGKTYHPDALRIQKQVRPDDIRVVSRDQPPPIVKAAEKVAEEAKPAHAPAEPAGEVASATAQPAGSATKPAEEACLLWKGLATKEAEQVTTLLKEKFADFRLVQQGEKKETKSWWVFISPLASKADAEKKVAELKQLGVKDYIVVQDPGSSRLALSLGVLATEAAARTHLAEMRRKGVRSAQIGPYGQKEVFSLEVRGPGLRQQSLLDSVKGLQLSAGVVVGNCP